MLFSFLTLCLTAFFLWVFADRRKNPNRAPGPFRYPLLGNLPQIIKADPMPYRAYYKLSETYGDIMSVKVGLQETVVLSSYEVMKDLLTKEDVSGRLLVGPLFDRTNGENLGIAFGNGEPQETLKVFAHRTLREFGFAKRDSMEALIRIELEDIMQKLNKISQNNGGRTVFERFFQLGFLNVLWGMLAGKRYSLDDPKLINLLKMNSQWFQSGVFGGGIVFAYPFLRYIFPDALGYNLQQKVNVKIFDYVKEMIAEHRSRDGFDTDPQSFNDVFLGQIQADAGKSNSAFTEDHFKITLFDMIQAGFETTSNTTAFGVLFMMLNQEVQAKVQKELDGFYSKGSIASMDDRDKIPYTSATVYEVFRLSNILPISGPRKTLADVEYNGYFIEKDTAVAFNTYAVMRSKKIWGDPDNFRPERFLDSKGNLNKMTEPMSIAFGAGKRSCLGEPLAQATVFMTFTTLMRNFKFEPVPGKPLPTTEPVFGMILAPQPYELVNWLKKEVFVVSL
ncbi:unnamed protein product [Allacma fusca]|uniref:Cytochrome P450 n=1 Tax=Allacma fusca TaxID=39272 RepID=A0A8J2KY67_9HEXA|nr:unnamed protein product [Allacma fusca]